MPVQALKPFQKDMWDWPDFFEKAGQESRISTGVLGHLYRDVSNEEPMQAFIKQDYLTAIMYDYELNQRIIDQVENTALMHSYLSEVNSTIVQPMIKKLKEIMIEFNFASEAELFASDLRFKMFDETNDNRYKCDIPLKNEDAMARLKGKLNRVVERFRSKCDTMVEKHREGKGERGIKDADSAMHIAVAMYLATYLDCNASTKAYYNLHTSDERFTKFFIDELLE